MLPKYDDMLNTAYEKIPKKALEHERFKIPKADSLIQGSKTIIQNFNLLIKAINRDEKHFLKYLTKETATNIEKGNNQLIINGKIGAIKLNRLIENYFTRFVLCPECKKPDTRVITQSGTKILKCDACGAISPVKGL